VANETILIVDADTKSQKVLEVSFKKAGYRVEIEDSPARAMAAIGRQDPDLIISDTEFEEGDGFEFLADLKLDNRTASIPFIFLTENRALPQKMRGFELGADDYLTKPVYIKEVTTRVELLLQKRAKTQLGETEIEEMEGALEDITMIDLLQQIEGELGTGSLRLVRGHREAVVYFREGNILDAICGKLQGEEAIYRLMLWPEGTFVLRYHDNVRRADNIEKDSSALLLEGIRRLEKFNDLTASLPRLSRVFEADYQRLPGLMDELPTEAARIVRLFDGMRSIRDVVDDSPVDDVTTLQIVAKLLGDDMLLDVTPQGETSEAEEQSNLAHWLEDKSPADLSGEMPVAEVGREDTSPKFGAVSTGKAQGEADEVERVDDDGKWKIHFDEDVDPEEAIKQIEAEEERRRRQEARQLAGFDKTLQQAPAVDRDEPKSGLSADLDDLMQAEKERRAEEARQLATQDENIRSTDMGFGHLQQENDDLEDLPRKHRVTERLQEAVSRTEPTGRAITEDDIAALERDSEDLREDTGPIDEEESQFGRGRKRRPTPISTPAGSIHGRSTDAEVEVDEASTRELPPAAEEPAEEKETTDTAEESRPNAAEMSVAESEEVAREAAKSRESGQFAPVQGSDDEAEEAEEHEQAEEHEKAEEHEEAEEREEEAEELEEVSETSAFLDAADGETESDLNLEEETADLSAEDEEFDPFPGDIDSLEEVSEADAFRDSDEHEAASERSEKVTRDLKAPVELTPLGAESSEPEIGDDLTPDHDAGFLEPEEPSEDGLEVSTDEFELEEIPAEAISDLPKVERISRDREMVTASYDLTKGSGQPEPKASEKDTVELPSAAVETEAVADDSTESEFFVDSDKSHEFDTFGEPEQDQGLPKVVLGILALLLIGGIWVIASNQSEPEPDTEEPAVAEKEEDDEPKEVAVKEDPKPAVDPAVDPEFEGQTNADSISDRASNLAMVYSGKDILAGNNDAGVASTDAGMLAQAEADMGEVALAGKDLGETPQPPDTPAIAAVEPETPTEKPVEKPVEKPTEKPVEKSEPAGPSVAQAQKLIRQEKFGDALSMLRDLSKEKPSDGKVAYLHGQAAFSDMKNSEAINNLERAERLGYRPANLYLDLAAAYTLDGKKSQAKTAYEKFLKLKPNGREADQVRKILESRF